MTIKIKMRINRQWLIKYDYCMLFLILCVQASSSSLVLYLMTKFNLINDEPKI